MDECPNIDVDPNYAKIQKNKQEYKAYLQKNKSYLTRLKDTEALFFVVLKLTTILFFGIASPLAWWLLDLHRIKPMIKRQLYICAITEYYEKYLKSFFDVDNNE